MFFGPIRKPRWPPWAADWLRHFRLILFNHWTEFNETWQEVKSHRPLPRLEVCVCFFFFFFFLGGGGGSENQNDRPCLWLDETFSASSLESLNGIWRNLTGSNILTSSTKFCFRAYRKTKMAAQASDWLRHFRLHLCNRWMEFNKTWQEARSQRLLQRLCFSGQSESQGGHHGPLIGWDIFDLFFSTTKRNSTKPDRK